VGRRRSEATPGRRVPKAPEGRGRRSRPGGGTGGAGSGRAGRFTPVMEKKAAKPPWHGQRGNLGWCRIGRGSEAISEVIAASIFFLTLLAFCAIIPA